MAASELAGGDLEEIEPENDFPGVRRWETFFLIKFHNNIGESEPYAEFECRALFRTASQGPYLWNFHLWRQLLWPLFNCLLRGSMFTMRDGSMSFALIDLTLRPA